EPGDDPGVARRSRHGAQGPEAVGALLGHEARAGLAQVEDAGDARLDKVGHGRRQLPPKLGVVVSVSPGRRGRSAPPELVRERHQDPARLAGDLAPEVEELVREGRPAEALDEGRRGPEVAPAGRRREDAPCEEALDVDERREADVPVLGASRAHPPGDVGHESLDLAGRGDRQGSPGQAVVERGEVVAPPKLGVQGSEVAVLGHLGAGIGLVDRPEGTQQRVVLPAALSELGRARPADVGEDVPHVLHPPQGGRLPPHRQLLRVHSSAALCGTDRPTHSAMDDDRMTAAAAVDRAFPPTPTSLAGIRTASRNASPHSSFLGRSAPSSAVTRLAAASEVPSAFKARRTSAAISRAKSCRKTGSGGTPSAFGGQAVDSSRPSGKDHGRKRTGRCRRRHRQDLRDMPRGIEGPA
ncbi:hypothetical protein THAOC_22248, partial [Thalassiosira oceanica]